MSITYMEHSQTGAKEKQIQALMKQKKLTESELENLQMIIKYLDDKSINGVLSDIEIEYLLEAMDI